MCLNTAGHVSGAQTLIFGGTEEGPNATPAPEAANV